MKLIIMGAPGAGKGTQAEIISERFDIPAISTGSVLRAAIKSGSDLGKLAKSLIDEGNFVPDEVINPIVQERIAKEDCENGFILDGYPRDLSQVIEFKSWNISIDRVLYINVSDDEIVNRLSGRRVCSECSETYHLVSQPSSAGDLCEACGGKLVIRKDDRPDTIRKRLQTYHEVTFPVIEHYRENGLLTEVFGVDSIENTTEKVLRVLEEIE